MEPLRQDTHDLDRIARIGFVHRPRSYARTLAAALTGPVFVAMTEPAGSRVELVLVVARSVIGGQRKEPAPFAGAGSRRAVTWGSGARPRSRRPESRRVRPPEIAKALTERSDVDHATIRGVVVLAVTVREANMS